MRNVVYYCSTRIFLQLRLGTRQIPNARTASGEVDDIKFGRIGPWLITCLQWSRMNLISISCSLEPQENRVKEGRGIVNSNYALF